MDKVMKAEIEKIITKAIRNWNKKQTFEPVELATSSLTSLIIKWLEGKNKEVTPVSFDYKGLSCPYCSTAIPNEEVYVHNQLITELIGEVR